MTDFHPFVMERFMSKFEQDVDFNLSESGVHPITLRELLGDAPARVERLLDTELNYPHVNGIPQLRENIARIYDGATPNNVLVTVGAIEANYIILRSLLSAGDDIVVMSPNYMQIWGVAMNHGLNVKTFPLVENRGWAPDLDVLSDAVTETTKLIAVCNPNNPTGRALRDDEVTAIVAIADRVGAWILADEVYAGAERTTDAQTPSFFGRYPKVMAVGSMSKAYGMPGVRTGWILGPEDALDACWARHEYVTISATMISNHLTALALSPEVRPRILERSRGFIRRGYPVLETWMNEHPGTFELTPPDAAAIAFMRYHLDINSSELAERLRAEQSVLVVPGDHFGMDRFLRVSFGLPEETLTAALDRIHALVHELRS